MIWVLLAAAVAEYFEGTVMINGLAHQISCSCGQPVTGVEGEMPLLGPAVCDTAVSSYIKEERPVSNESAEVLRDDDVSLYYGQPRLTTVVPFGELPEFRCADGRWSTSEVYTMGGDLAELLHVLNALDTLRQSANADLLTPSEIGTAVMAWLSSGFARTLTFCTDRVAVGALSAHLGPSSVDLNLMSEGLRESAIKALQEDASMHGDIFWKCVVGFPTQYHIRVELLKGLLESFFTVHWTEGQNNTSTKIHTGDHKPMAILALKEKENCSALGGASIASKQLLLGGKTVSALIYHPDSVTQRRRQMIHTLIALNTGGKTEEEILQVVQHNSNEWTEACITSSFPTLPIYSLVFQ